MYHLVYFLAFSKYSEFVAVSDELIRTLGQGTFGRVVECRDLDKYVLLCKY